MVTRIGRRDERARGSISDQVPGIARV